MTICYDSDLIPVIHVFPCTAKKVHLAGSKLTCPTVSPSGTTVKSGELLSTK